ncbi:IS66 family transposase zinc-finger binding domain-containing protein, partial [Actibacterium sp. 188UL27-1]|uniref:IS66 family transposase zinc-finger binding domain-containing protein n=1 Tax=Actibacterium sp. 188UL27-1 TaxID=2786961 RepID=UPI00195A5D54
MRYIAGMTVDPKSLDLSLLPPEHRAAFELLLAKSERVAELEAVTARLEALIKELHQALYGKKSEKLPEDDRQLAFEDLTVAIAEAEEAKDAQQPEKPRRRAAPIQKNLGHLPEHLPRIEEVIEPDTLDCPCGSGRMHRIGEDRTERLDIVPAQLRVIVTVRPKYACRACTDGI